MFFEGKSEAEARREILALVREYCDAYHHTGGQCLPGERVPFSARVYDGEEMANLVDSALDFQLTSGRYTARFEREFGAYLGVEYCTFVNSGSSACLLALMALTSPTLGERALRRGDEVITVAAGFPTTVAPAVQYGAVPVFVDITLPQYNIDVAQLEAALSPKTRAVMVAHTLGNPFDLAAVRDFCDKYDLWMIEDNCDALGAEYTYRGKRYKTGAVGDISTSSFYPAHHITTGEGGMVCTRQPELHRIIRSMRDWGRDCVCPPGKDDTCGHRFEGQYGELPAGYDHKYVYAHFGYNLKATEMQAAIGCAQLQKLPDFVTRRRANFARLAEALAPARDRLILPEPCPDSLPSWFGFPLTCGKGVSRAAVIAKLEAAGIQTRMLFAGNLTRHPCFDEMRRAQNGYRTVGDLPVTDRVMRDTFWVGVYPGMDDQTVDRVAGAILCAIE